MIEVPDITDALASVQPPCSPVVADQAVQTLKSDAEAPDGAVSAVSDVKASMSPDAANPAMTGPGSLNVVELLLLMLKSATSPPAEVSGFAAGLL